MPYLFVILLGLLNVAYGASPDLRRKCWDEATKQNFEMSTKAAAYLCAEVQSESQIASLISCWRRVYTAYPTGKDIHDTEAAILCAHRLQPEAGDCPGR